MEEVDRSGLVWIEAAFPEAGPAQALSSRMAAAAATSRSDRENARDTSSQSLGRLSGSIDLGRR